MAENKEKKPIKGTEVEPGLDKSQNVEERILNAARDEFIQYGLKGARMQQIADRAWVNKALLHYYFRSKDKLYGAVLDSMFRKVQGTMQSKFSQSPPESLEQVFRSIVSTYIQVFAQSPEFPLFLAQELNRGSEPAFQSIGSFTTFIQFMKARLAAFLDKEIAAGRIRPIPLQQLMLNLMGMTLGTFFLKPLTKIIGPGLGVKFGYDEEFYKERVESIVRMVMYGLRGTDGGEV